MSDRETLERATAYVEDLPGFKRSEPQYFRDPMIDHLLEVVILMGGEIWTLRHRQAIVEKLLAAGETVSADMIETFVADQDFTDQLQAERHDLVRRLFGGLPGTPAENPEGKGFQWVTKTGRGEQD